MKEDFRTRWIQLAVALALVAVIALTGLGLSLLSTRSRHLSKVLFNAAVDTAQGRILPKIQEHLAAVESQALEALVAAADKFTAENGEVLRDLRLKHQAIDTPFLLAADLTFLYPRPGPKPGQPPLLGSTYEALPEDFHNAMRLLWSSAPSDETLRALESVYRAPELAAPWRLRALSAMASYYLRLDQPAKAEGIYRQLFQEFSRELQETTWPSVLHLTLAHAQALKKNRQGEAAELLLKESFKKLLDDHIVSSSQEEEEFFVQSLLQWIQPRSSISGPPSSESSELQQLLQLYRHRNRKAQFSSTLRDWILTRIRMARENGEVSAGPQRSSENFSGTRYLIIWRSDVALPSGSKLAAVGFRFHPEIFRETMEETLFMLNASTESGDGAEPLKFRLFSSEDEAGDLPAVALPAFFQPLRLGVEKESWRRYLQDNRRPFLIAGVLIPALGAGMALALITFYRAYRRERFLSKMKTDFVANVSHELKTPLALIRLFGETLLLDRVNDQNKQKEYYRIITRESERLTHLINNVLNFASIEAGKKTYELRPTDISSVVRETLSAYQFELDQKGFTLEADLAGGLPEIPADPDGIAQALINLLNNAVKYSPEEKWIGVRLWQENGSIRLTIRDRGLGIDKVDQKRIFEGFYRSEAARKLSSRGSGLGLSLVRHIMRSHGGRIEIDSAPGAGSAFTLVLPCRESREKNARSEEKITSKNHEENHP